MVDRGIQCGTCTGFVDIWDHTSHMREYVTDSEMIRNTSGLPTSVHILHFAHVALLTYGFLVVAVDI